MVPTEDIPTAILENMDRDFDLIDSKNADL